MWKDTCVAFGLSTRTIRKPQRKINVQLLTQTNNNKTGAGEIGAERRLSNPTLKLQLGK